LRFHLFFCCVWKGRVNSGCVGGGGGGGGGEGGARLPRTNQLIENSWTSKVNEKQRYTVG